MEIFLSPAQSSMGVAESWNTRQVSVNYMNQYFLVTILYTTVQIIFRCKHFTLTLKLSNVWYYKFTFKVHIRAEGCEGWFLLMTIPVKPLSPEPNIREETMLSDVQGIYSLRVAARNIAGLGKTSELEVTLEGNYRGRGIKIRICIIVYWIFVRESDLSHLSFL